MLSESNAAMTVLERLAKQTLDGRLAVKAVKFTQLNPEQQLAVVLEMLVTKKKEELALLQTLTILAAETVAWKKTDEGIKWDELQRGKRERQLEKAHADNQHTGSTGAADQCPRS